MLWCKELKDCYIDVVKGYKKAKDNNNTHLFSDNVLKILSEAGYIHDHGIDDNINIEEASKPYYDYLKYGVKPYQEEVKEEPIMIEDNYNNYDYTTPYSFEYEPYLLDNNNYRITFDHEVDTSNTMEIIEEIYNEDNINEDANIDSNDVINIMNILTNKISKVKKCIIHYISNYRPIMNQYTFINIRHTPHTNYYSINIASIL